MTGHDESDDGAGDQPRSKAILAFPFSRVAPAQSADPNGPIMYGAFASLMGMPQEQTTGHWCSHCRMIWFGYLLEVACPSCGNRHG
jgi:hypothetical protein